MSLPLSHIATLIISIYININDKKIPFNVSKPEIKVELTKDLKEISGLTWYNGQLGAVQDESGRMYLLNSNTGVIEKKVKFSLP